MASSSSNPTPPAERAAEIVDKLPSHPSLITKTGTAILGSGLLATAISQELYVFNEETVIAVGYLILFGYIAKVCVFFLRYPELFFFLKKKPIATTDHPPALQRMGREPHYAHQERA